MKRIYIAILFIIISLCAAAFETGYISAKVELFTAKIDLADKMMYQGETEQAARICLEAENEWNESSKIIDMLLIHDYVDSIGNNISQMKSLAENDSKELYFAKSVAAKKELASIKESEYPFVENIM